MWINQTLQKSANKAKDLFYLKNYTIPKKMVYCRKKGKTGGGNPLLAFVINESKIELRGLTSKNFHIKKSKKGKFLFLDLNRVYKNKIKSKNYNLIKLNS